MPSPLSSEGTLIVKFAGGQLISSPFLAGTVSFADALKQFERLPSLLPLQPELLPRLPG